MTKEQKNYLISGLGILATFIVYFLTRKSNNNIAVVQSLAGESSLTPNAATYPQASIQMPNISVPANQTYLSYNFGPKNDLAKVVPDNSPLSVYIPGASSTIVSPPPSAQNSGGCSGCGDKCKGSNTNVAYFSTTSNSIQKQYANLVSLYGAN